MPRASVTLVYCLKILKTRNILSRCHLGITCPILSGCEFQAVKERLILYMLQWPILTNFNLIA